MNTEHDVSSMGEPTEERISLRMRVHTDAPSHGMPASAAISVPPLGAVWLRYDATGEVGTAS